MPRRILVQHGTERFDVVEKPAPNEHALQEVMKANPQLIPSDDVGLHGTLLVVGRETVLASGAIDLLCLARTGDLVLVEFKTGPQNPDFRHALAQVIDYGSDLWGRSVDEFDRGVVQRYLTGAHCDAACKGAKDIAEAIARTDWGLADTEKDALTRRLSDVLRDGDFVHVIAAQRFTTGMTTSLDYLNATMRHGRFYFIEVVRLEGVDVVAHAAQVVASPQRIVRSGSSATAIQANEADFLAAVASEDYREALKDIFATCEILGLSVYWGAKGASLRLRTPDRHELLSIGWAFLEGDQFSGAKHLTFGVDEASLQHTPSVQPEVLAFVEQVKNVPGAKPAPSKLRAYTFEPGTVPAAKAAIVAALEALVESGQSGKARV